MHLALERYNKLRALYRLARAKKTKVTQMMESYVSTTPSQPPTGTPPSSHPWRKPLLALEFIALGVLVGSMAILSNLSQGTDAPNPAWLLIPALASLGVFASFIGLMYLRWVVAASAERQLRHKIIFGLLALTLLGVWLYSVVQTWLSLGA